MDGKAMAARHCGGARQRRQMARRAAVARGGAAARAGAVRQRGQGLCGGRSGGGRR
jgi:hypothetical protein